MQKINLIIPAKEEIENLFNIINPLIKKFNHIGININQIKRHKIYTKNGMCHTMMN